MSKILTRTIRAGETYFALEPRRLATLAAARRPTLGIRVGIDMAPENRHAVRSEGPQYQRQTHRCRKMRA